MQVNVIDSLGSGIWNERCFCGSDDVSDDSALLACLCGGAGGVEGVSFAARGDEDRARVLAGNRSARNAHGRGGRGVTRAMPESGCQRRAVAWRAEYISCPVHKWERASRKSKRKRESSGHSAAPAPSYSKPRGKEIRSE